MTHATYDVFDRHATFGVGHDRSIGFLAAQIAFILQFSAQVSRWGLIVAAPIADRIMRVDLLTASRNAALAFSIRCQRSATWRGFGGALAAAPLTTATIT
jgi:hypothetical protein